MGIGRSDQLSAERRELIERCLADGWSWHQIYKTHGVTWATMKRHYDGTQWTLKQGAILGAAHRQAQQKGVWL